MSAKGAFGWRGLLVLSSCLLAGATAEGQVVDVQPLSEHVILLNVPAFGHANAVAVASDRGLVMIDTGLSPVVGKELTAAAERHFHRSDWAYAINTHAHAHHAGGNAAFKHLPIIGHRNIADEMTNGWLPFLKDEKKRAEVAARQRQKAQELATGERKEGESEEAIQARIGLLTAVAEEVAAGFEVVLPTLSFSDELRLDLGNLTMQARYFGKGHSQSDIVIHIPEEGVLVTSGVCYPVVPRIGPPKDLADLERSIKILDDILERSGESLRVVPAHAEVLGRADLERMRDYTRDLLSEVKAARAKGQELAEAQAELALDRHFPYMASVTMPEGKATERHSENIKAAWELLAH